jgi:hypothetical protein
MVLRVVVLLRDWCERGRGRLNAAYYNDSYTN